MQKNILIIDHNADNIDILEKYLHSDLFDVTIAGDATVARILLSKKTFDLVITAALLPKSHGNTLAKYICKTYPKTRVIIISDKVEDPQVREEAIESGACDFFEKPLDEADFRQKVMNHLGLGGADLFREHSTDSTKIMVLPMLDEIRKGSDKDPKKSESEGFDDIIKDEEDKSDSFEIKLD